MPIIEIEDILARRDEAGRPVSCKNCLSEKDLQQIAYNEIMLRGTIEDLYREGKIVFCDSCEINMYRFISSAEKNEA